MTESLMTAKEAAKRLGTSEGVLAKWRHESRGPSFFKTEGSIRYDRADLEQWIEAQKVVTS